MEQAMLVTAKMLTTEAISVGIATRPGAALVLSNTIADLQGAILIV